MKKCIITFLILGLTLASFSQTDCNCEQALSQLIERVESDYPGFKEKTTHKLIYENFKKELQNQSKNVQEADCFELLKAYLAYFKDGHITLTKSGGKKPVKTEKQDTKTSEKLDVNLKSFKKHISTTTDDLEGIWKSGGYKVGIIKKEGKYQTFIIESANKSWKANEVKFSLMDDGKANYFMGDHSLREDNYELNVTINM
jgi:hypothetical protein